MVAARAGIAAAVFLLGGCLTAVSSGIGGNGAGSGTGAGVETGSSTGVASGSSTGAAAAASTGGGAPACGPESNLSDLANYTFSGAYRLISADLNGDGLLDLLGATAPNGGIEVSFGQAGGGLSAPTRYLQADGNAVALGDFNGDGWPDVVASNASGLVILLNDGSGGLNSSSTIDLEGAFDIADLAAADFNGDGLADLLVAEETYHSLQIVVLFALAPGIFAAPVVLPGVGSTAGPSTAVGVFLVGDFNQDRLPDIATSDGVEVAVSLDQGDGGFETTLYPMPAFNQLILWPRAGAPPDLAAATIADESGLHGLQVLENSGEGAFSFGPFYSGVFGWQLLVGDFNGDRIPDIAASQGSECTSLDPPSSVTVFYGDGDGGFGGPVRLPVSEQEASSMALLGPVANPGALAVANGCADGGVAVYGCAGKR